ncbi:glycosyltransferase family 25 protein [Aquamicrobium ahrensii]|uniref:Glycosyl transferase family 25 n=1 Tax=Aquamicrobium ahrensii TaxID=469551 RepID=A0ABV2KIR1_9HYPH
MKVYYINLDRSPERRAWFTRQTDALGLDLVRVSAVDGRELPAAELDHWRKLSEGHKALSAGEIGCFLSHRKAWGAVLAGNEKWAFVAEDDIHFSRNAAAFLSDDSWIPAQAGLVKAETDLRRHEFSPASWPAPCGHELRRLKASHLGTGGYFLTPATAAHLLAFTERRCEAIDGLLFATGYMRQHKLEVLQILPAICIQDVYLDEHMDTAILESIVDKERVEGRVATKKRTMTPFTKLTREVRRVLMQVSNIFRRAYLRLARKSVFKLIDFDGR